MPPLTELKADSTACENSWIPVSPETTWFANLDPISERLISPKLPFIQIRRLRHEGSYGTVGQVINVPVDVNNMARQLPRRLDDDYALNGNINLYICMVSSGNQSFELG
jgi:hypothetical protein